MFNVKQEHIKNHVFSFIKLNGRFNRANIFLTNLLADILID